MTRLCVAATISVALGAIALRAEQAPIVVASDGSGQFNTVQSAIDSIPDRNTEPRVIVIKPGTYKERLLINSRKTFITLRGADKDAGKTILTFNRYWGMEDPEAPGKKLDTGDTASVLIEADNFTAENISFENSTDLRIRAVAVRLTGDKQVFRNCGFFGWQDTLFVDGKRAYFEDCYIEGSADFIFGHATAVFENCLIRSKIGAFVTAAGTPPDRPFGLVFLKCKLVGVTAKSYLGRPWKEGAATAFIECELGDHLRPEGWAQWRGNENHKTARYVEYRNTGPGSDTRNRPAWSRQLTESEAKAYTVQNILGGEDRWNPRQ